MKNLEQLLEPEPQGLVTSLLILLGVTVLSCSAAAGFWYWRWRRGGSLLPPQRHRVVPWSGWEVLATWFVYWLAIQIAFTILSSTGILTHVYGPDFLALLRGDSSEAQLAKNRLAVWATVVAFPLQLVGIAYVLNTVSGTRPYQFGLTWHRFGANIQVGFLAWLVLQPLVLTVNVLVTVAYQALTDTTPEPHKLVELVRNEPLVIEWVLLVFTAVVVAPVMEELLCRGILLPWAASRSSGSDIVMAVTFLIALGFHLGDVSRAVGDRNWQNLFVVLQPAGFVLLMLPGYLLVRYMFQPTKSRDDRAVELVGAPDEPRPWGSVEKTQESSSASLSKSSRRPAQSQAVCAIYATALLFGSIHSNWPTPVALFVLGLGLGWLAYRTQSLVGPIVLHMLFNGVACVTLFVSQAPPAPAPSNGSETTEAMHSAPPASTCTAVPGSQVPRRR